MISLMYLNIIRICISHVSIVNDYLTLTWLDQRSTIYITVTVLSTPWGADSESWHLYLVTVWAPVAVYRRSLLNTHHQPRQGLNSELSFKYNFALTLSHWCFVQCTYFHGITVTFFSNFNQITESQPIDRHELNWCWQKRWNADIAALSRNLHQFTVHINKAISETNQQINIRAQPKLI